MNIHVFQLGPLGTNGYLLVNDHKKGVFFDPGGISEVLINKLKQEKIEIQAILLTHAHFDHIGGVEELRKLTHAPVVIHKEEREWLLNPRLNGSSGMPWSNFISPVVCKEADQLIEHEGEYTFGDFTFMIYHTPGHSPGSLSYSIDGMVLSGDTLFHGGIGRTDLYGGDTNTLISSIKNKLYTMPDETFVYPGHGDKTTIGYEKKSNPFING